MAKSQERIPEPLRSKVAEGMRAAVMKDFITARQLALELVDSIDLLTERRYDADILALRAETRALKVDLERPECSCCGTVKNLHRDFGSGGPYRCNSYDCVMF